MKNKQHEYILKAFAQSKIPTAIRVNCPDLIIVDSTVGGFCIQLLNTGKIADNLLEPIVPRTAKMAISELINSSTGNAKEELVIYYRLLVLTESVIKQYG